MVSQQHGNGFSSFTNNVGQIWLDEEGYLVSSAADYLEMCGCLNASFDNPFFDLQHFDESFDLRERWALGLLIDYANSISGYLARHEHAAKKQALQVFRDELGEVRFLHLHKTVLGQFAKRNGGLLPPDMRDFLGDIQLSFAANVMSAILGRECKRPAKTKRMESWYRDALHEAVGGEVEVRLSASSIADVVTSSTLYEVKHVKHWERAVGQLSRYQMHQPRKQKAMVLFGECKKIDLKASAELAETVGVKTYFMDENGCVSLVPSNA